MNHDLLTHKTFILGVMIGFCVHTPLFGQEIQGNAASVQFTKQKIASESYESGGRDPIGLYYYKWNGGSFVKQTIAYGPLGEGKGTGIYFSVTDLTGNGYRDIVAAGKEGLYIFFNKGSDSGRVQGIKVKSIYTGYRFPDMW